MPCANECSRLPIAEKFAENSVGRTLSGCSVMDRKPKIDLGDVTPQNIKQLKLINQVVFPVSYNDKFYRDVLEAGELAKLCYYNDIIVGAVCCRVDTTENQRRLYIMTLGCLAPYRRRGLGKKMLEHVLNYVEKDGNFDSVFLHVQINNEGAINFYKEFGFEIIETKEHYYKRIDPADAYVLSKEVGKSAATRLPTPVPVNGHAVSNATTTTSGKANDSRGKAAGDREA